MSHLTRTIVCLYGRLNALYPGDNVVTDTSDGMTESTPGVPGDDPGRRQVRTGPTTSRLDLRGVSKTFPGVRALRGVDLEVHGGSVHALLGHNGCGKSTLVKALAGFHAPDGGCRATIDGEAFELGSADAAERLGIRFVHQDLGLVPELGAVDNVGLALGYERGRFGVIRWRRQARVTKELLSRFGIDLDPRSPLSMATPVERTAVAIVRAMAGLERGRGLLVLDEPTAALPAREVDELFRLIREVRDSGTAVLLISHRLDEVVNIADRATVMRSGEVIWDGAVADMSVRAFAALIAGSETGQTEEADRPRSAEAFAGAPVRLKLEGVAGRYLRGVDAEVRAGEILGVAGLLGSGREDLPYIIAGATTDGVVGRFTVDGAVFESMTLQRARGLGIALVPADRSGESIIGDFSVKENVTLPGLPGLCRGTTLSPSQERAFARTWLGAMRADTATAERPVTTLSGGNQQKAVLARWLSVSPKILTMSEPTAGIDIGARTSIYEELRQRAADGLAIVVSSSDAEDLVALCDRVIVLRDGKVTAELDGPQISKSAIVAAMEGVQDDQQN
jgi:ribose transport system ATP-binding protein